MISPATAAPLTPPEKAQVIYEQARSDMAGRLWRAALGTEDENIAPTGPLKNGASGLNLLIALLDEQRAAMQVPPIPVREERAHSSEQDAQTDHGRGHAPPPVMRDDERTGGDGSEVSAKSYGPNAGYAAILNAASRRTGLPSAALATIVDAEAAKDKDGRWLPYSRNPRSSAAGLSQFLSATWVGEANRKGTWLNNMAEQNGWLSAQGKVKSGHRAELLSLRYNPQAAIEATADYAASNLAALRKAGVGIADSAQAIAKAAYLGHHLGQGDAARFLKGGLDPNRARILLEAQIGVSASSRRIAASGNASFAHKTWLNEYISQNVQVGRFHA